jgi:cytidylate kinase
MTQLPKLGPVIAIDGPAGTGKSSATKQLCSRLGFTHVDTGALYRSIALLLKEALEVSAEDPSREKNTAAPEVLSEEQQARAVEVARTAHLEFKRDSSKNPPNRVWANGRDVTDLIRTPDISMWSSRVSAVPGVRAAQLGMQRRLGCVGKTILEGRDIGTVVFPDADVKFFLTATPDERAHRRLAELKASGKPTPTFEELRAQIQERDAADAGRSVAPMRRAEDAIEIDTSSMSLEQVVSRMETLARAKLGL